MISFDCEHCSKAISFDDDWAGRMGRCPSCQHILEIPGQPDDTLASEPELPANDDTAEIIITPDTKDPADETDIMPAQGAESRSQVDPETARNDADSWLRTYKQSKAVENRRSYIRWGLIVAAAVVVLVLLIIIF